jgi:Na+-transporting NADH:ubiquinone oxidoreductase subunit C
MREGNIMSDNVYTLLYAAVICFICSFLLSLFAMGLKPAQERAATLDLHKKILSVLELYQEGMSEEEVDQVFSSSVKEAVLDRKGLIIEGVDFKSIPEAERCKVLSMDWDSNPADCKLSVYQKLVGDKISAIAIPLVGKGLWSTLYGYLALSPDATTVTGITFYKHGETPGLGAEISESWFQKNFLGKKILDPEGGVYGIVVSKGKAKNSGHPLVHSVDGISGATITSNGVTSLIKHCLKVYDPYLKKFRKEES